MVACSNRAALLGIKPGLTLAQARALCADVQYTDWRPDQDEKTLEALARYLIRFTPTVALETRDITEDLAEPSAGLRPSYLFLDLTGCEHLFGGLEPMLTQIGQTLHRLRLPATLAVASTPGAAYALTGLPPDKNEPPTRIRLIPIANRKSQIANIPLSGLRLPEDLLASLHHLGLETIDQLQKLPRSALPSRFGPLILRRLDQLTGQTPEPLIPLTWSTTIQTHFDFDGSVCDPQALELAFKEMLTRLLPQLEKQNHGIRELDVTFLTEKGSRDEMRQKETPKTASHPRSAPPRDRMRQNETPQQMSHIEVSRPTRDPKALLILYRTAFDQIQLQHQGGKPRYSRNYDQGFTGMTLKITRTQPLPHQQIEMGHSKKVEGEHAWQRTLDLIRTRLGEGTIEQVELQESYLPEKAFKRLPPGLEAPPTPLAGFSIGSRPLQLEERPVELRVMVAPSQEVDGVPLTFNLEGSAHTVVYALGPERIAGQWWEGHNKTRDYFEVADSTGHRYWVFRVQETGKWYLHGKFE